MKNFGWHLGDFLKGADSDNLFIVLATLVTVLLVVGFISSGILSPAQ